MRELLAYPPQTAPRTLSPFHPLNRLQNTVRGASHLGGWRYRKLAELARGARGEDASGYRAELIQLIELAEALSSPDATGAQIAD